MTERATWEKVPKEPFSSSEFRALLDEEAQIEWLRSFGITKASSCVPKDCFGGRFFIRTEAITTGRDQVTAVPEVIVAGS